MPARQLSVRQRQLEVAFPSSPLAAAPCRAESLLRSCPLAHEPSQSSQTFGLSNCKTTKDLLIRRKFSILFVIILVYTFRKFGDSFKEFTPPLSSPTMMIRSLWLKLTCVNLLALFTTFCSHNGSCLFSARSKI